MRKLTEVWNDLETDERSLFEVVKTLAESHGIHPSDQDIKEFVQKSEPLVNQVSIGTKKPGADHSKPEFFTVKKAGEEPFHEAVKNWTGVRLGVCRLMLKRNGEGFRQFVSERPDWFLDAPVSTGKRLIKQGFSFVPAVLGKALSRFAAKSWPSSGTRKNLSRFR